jgi:predicted nucleic acid-binding protein
LKVLVDTNVWSAGFRRNKQAASGLTQQLSDLIEDHRVEIIGPIRQEILSGIRDEAQFEIVKTHLDAFLDIPTTSEDYVTAAKFFNLCRSKGIQGSNTDFLICSVAVRYHLSIFTKDKDFGYFAKYLPIVFYEP